MAFKTPEELSVENREAALKLKDKGILDGLIPVRIDSKTTIYKKPKKV
jgi:hypothetical protein